MGRATQALDQTQCRTRQPMQDKHTDHTQCRTRQPIQDKHRDHIVLDYSHALSRTTVQQDYRPYIGQYYSPNIWQDYRPHIRQDCRPYIWQDYRLYIGQQYTVHTVWQDQADGVGVVALDIVLTTTCFFFNLFQQRAMNSLNIKLADYLTLMKTER